jgi:hypothetical protein
MLDLRAQERGTVRLSLSSEQYSTHRDDRRRRRARLAKLRTSGSNATRLVDSAREAILWKTDLHRLKDEFFSEIPYV